MFTQLFSRGESSDRNYRQIATLEVKRRSERTN